MEKDLQWLTVSSQHNELRLTTVKGLGGLVGSLSHLLVVGCLLNQVQNLGGQSLLGEGVSLGVNFLSHLCSGLFGLL